MAMHTEDGGNQKAVGKVDGKDCSKLMWWHDTSMEIMVSKGKQAVGTHKNSKKYRN